MMSCNLRGSPLGSAMCSPRGAESRGLSRPVNHVLHISDCHLVTTGATLIGVDTQASLEAILRQALAERVPDAVIVSGDIAHDPTREVYARFLATMRRLVAAPFMCLAGNHDVRGVMESVGLPFGPLVVGPWCLAGLDSHEDEMPVALVCEEDRSALARDLLANTSQHTFWLPLITRCCP